MAHEFRLPDIGEGLTEAEIVRWLVGVGDEVESDQPIVEVETDKAVVEIPSPLAGVIVSLGGVEGDVVEVGEVLVAIGKAEEVPDPPARDETIPPHNEATAFSTGRSDEASDGEGEHEPIVGTLGSETETLASSAAEERPISKSVKALPLVRKLARENDVDLETVEGTGPGGRIMRGDVEAVIGAGEPAPSPEPEPAPPPRSETKGEEASPKTTERTVTAHDEDQRQTMSRLRRTIAANMSKSWAEIPHVTTFDDVDATRLLEVRRALGERHGTKIPLEALVVKAVVPALEEFPEFNSSLDGEDLVYHRAKDIGVAVDTPDGLLVGVIRHAERKSVKELTGEVRRLGDGARERTLPPEELTGQTFTVSNIGAVGGGHGTPIVPFGTVAILSVGAARLRPVVYEEDLAVAPIMPLSLSYDHRVIDGAVGRRFMALVIENLEEPALFLAG